MRIEGSVMVMYIAAMQMRATRRGVNRVVKKKISVCAREGGRGSLSSTQTHGSRRP